MAQPIAITNAITVQAGGTAVTTAIPHDSAIRAPQYVRVTATGNGVYIKFGADNTVTATANDTFVVSGDSAIMNVSGYKFFSVLQVSGAAKACVAALERGSFDTAATLDLRFAETGALDSRVTFSRGSAATYFDRTGTLQAASSSAARFDYDPTTLAAKGLLIEEQRTNLLTYSEAFDNAAWTKTRASITANATTAPDGTTTADKLVEDSTASATHLAASASVSLNSGVVYAYSIYAKAAERTFLRLQVGIGGGAYGALVTACFFDLVNGTVGAASDSAVGSIQAIGNGWYRCSMQAPATTASSSADLRAKISSSGSSDSYTGDGASGLYLWGAQVEAGAFPTSYIPTTTAAATRLADVATMTGSNFSNWYNAAAGTLMVEFDVPATTSDPGTRVVAGTSDGTFNNSIYIARNPSSGNVNANIVASGSGQVGFTSPGSVTPNIASKFAMAFATNDANEALNGALATTDTVITVPTGQTAMTLGNANWVGSANVINGHIRRLTYYPSRLANATLQALTS